MTKKGMALLALVFLSAIFLLNKPTYGADRGAYVAVDRAPARSYSTSPARIYPIMFEASLPIFGHDLTVDSSPNTVYEGIGSGFRMNFEYHTPLFMRAELTAGFAQLDHRNTTNQLDFSSVNTEFDIGLTLGRGALRVIPYLGLGVNFLDYSDPSQSSLPVNFTYGYFPLGVKAELKITPMITLGLDVSVRIMISGEVSLEYSQVNPSNSDVTDDLKPTVGVRIIIPLDIYLTPPGLRSRLALSLALWYEYHPLETNSTNQVIQIKNMTYQNVGVLMGVKFLW